MVLFPNQTFEIPAESEFKLREFTEILDDNASPKDAGYVIELVTFLYNERISVPSDQYRLVRDLYSMIPDEISCHYRPLKEFIKITEEFGDKPALGPFFEYVKTNGVSKCIDEIIDKFEKLENETLFYRDIRMIRKEFINLISKDSICSDLIRQSKVPLYSMLTTEKIQDSSLKLVAAKIEDKNIDLKDETISRDLIDRIYKSLFADTRDIRLSMKDEYSCLPLLEKMSLNKIASAPIRSQEFLIDFKIISSLDDGFWPIHELYQLLNIQAIKGSNWISNLYGLSFSERLDRFEKLIGETLPHAETWDSVFILTRSLISGARLMPQAIKPDEGSLLEMANAIYSLSKMKGRYYTPQDASKVLTDLEQFKDKPGLELYLNHFRGEYVSSALKQVKAFVQYAEEHSSTPLILAREVVDQVVLKIYRDALSIMERTGSGDEIPAEPLYSLVTKALIEEALGAYLNKFKINDIERVVEAFRARCLHHLDSIKREMSIMPILEALDKRLIIDSEKEVKWTLVFGKMVLLFENGINYNNIKAAMRR